MEAVLIVLAIGGLVIAIDYGMATAVDPKDRLKRRRKMTPAEKKMLREMFYLTCIIAFATWLVPRLFD